MIFFDNASTTRPFDEVTELVAKTSKELFFNASATYRAGIESFHAINGARAVLAGALGVGPEEIIFTSGGTESDNIAVLGGFKNRRGRVISSETEHPAVYHCVAELRSRGAEVVTVRTLPDGSPDFSHFEELLAGGEVSLVTLMQANNETGVLTDIPKFARAAKRAWPDCVFHTDGVQGFLKSPLDLGEVDLYSVSAHKIHGPKGIGALYVNKNLHIKSLVFGGGQERGLRSGTENTPAILGFARAAALYRERAGEILAACAQIKQILLETFRGAGLDFRVNGERCLDSILSVGFRGVRAEILYQLLSDENICVSRGSACSTRVKDSRIIRAMGVPKEYAGGTLRFSTGFGNTLEEARTVADTVVRLVKKFARG